MQFLMIQGRLLANPTFNATDKLIISFIHNLGVANKRYFGDSKWLSSELGCNETFVQSRLERLLEYGVLEKFEDGIGLGDVPEKIFQFSIDNKSRELLESLVNSISQSYHKEV